MNGPVVTWDWMKYQQWSSSDLGLDSLDEVPVLVSFTLLGTDNNVHGKGVNSDSVMSRGC